MHRKPWCAIAAAVLLLAVLLPMDSHRASAAGWATQDIASTGKNVNEIVVGDVDGDGQAEIYGSSKKGSLLKFTLSGGKWSWEEVMKVDDEIHGLAIGDGDNDGKVELYAAGFTYDPILDVIYRITYSAASGWRKSVISSPYSRYTYEIAVGDGDNDGRNEVYTSSDGVIYRYSYSGGNWDYTYIADAYYQWIIYWYDVAVGDGDGDGSKEVYGGTYQRKIQQVEYTGAWGTSWVGDGQPIYIGDADNDGRGEVYTFFEDVLYQYVYSSGSWTKTQIDAVANSNEMYDAAIGDGDNDGKNELYVATSNGTVVQYTYKSGSWTHEELGKATDDMLTVAVADVDPDWRGNEVYGGSDDGHLYRFLPDREPPENPFVWSPTHTPGVWSNRSVVVVEWKMPKDDLSGVDGYSYSWSRYAFTVPDNIKDAEEWQKKTNSDLLPDGNDHWFHIKAGDNAGNWNPGATHFGPLLIDTTPPRLVSLSINGGAAYTSGPAATLSLNAEDAASGVVDAAFSNDGSTWSDWEPYAALRAGWSLTTGAGGSDTDGLKTVYARVRDRAGNIGTVLTDTIILDRAPPDGLSIEINGGAAYTNATAVSLALKAKDAASGVERMAFSNDGGTTWSPWEPYAGTKNPWDLVSGAGGKAGDGTKQVHFRVSDFAGNTAGPANDSIFLDTQVPSATLTINGGARTTNTTAVKLETGVSDPVPASGVSEMRFSTDGALWGAWEPYAPVRAFTLPSGDGEKTVYLQVRDRAGNPSAAAPDTIMLDTTPPLISTVRVNDITASSAVVTWLTDEPADGVVEYGSAPGNYILSERGTGFAALHGVALKGLMPSTTYYFRVKSTDEAGNGPSVAGEFSFTTSALPDTTPPRIYDVRVEGITDSSAVVLWRTDEVAEGKVEFGTTVALGKVAKESGYVIQHSLLLSGLAPSTLYHFRITASDASGNTGATGDLTFNTTATPDRTAPRITGVYADGITDTAALVHWTTDEPADSTVRYGLASPPALSAYDGRYIAVHAVLLTNLTPGRTYTFTVRSADPSGNTATSDPYTFTTLTSPDRTPPLISDVAVTAITNNSALVTWRTDEPADGAVEFGDTASYGRNGSDPALTKTHAILLTGLRSGALHHFRVKSTDLSGNPSATGDFTFTTLARGDDTPPAISNLRVLSVSDSTAVVMWDTDEPADSAVEFGPKGAGLTLRAADGEFTLVHSVLLSGLSANTTYNLRARSRDPSGNEAVQDGAPFNTSGVRDTRPPAITGLRAVNITSTTAVIVWYTDEPAGSELHWGNTTALAENRSFPKFLLEHSAPLAGLVPGTTYYFNVRAWDPSGNYNLSLVLNFTTRAAALPGNGGGVSVSSWDPLLVLLLLAVLAGGCAGGYGGLILGQRFKGGGKRDSMELRFPVSATPVADGEAGETAFNLIEGH